MRKLVTLLAVFAVLTLVLPGGAFADMMPVVSDPTVEWSDDGTSWNPTVACWTHPSWPLISGATWIWRTELTREQIEWEYSNVPEGGWYFQKIFTIPGSPIACDIEIGADNAYRLYLNGTPIGGDGAMSVDGPDNAEWKFTETYLGLTNLNFGDNTILIRALNYNSGLHPGPVAGYDYGNPQKNPAGIIFKATIEYEPEIPVSVDIKPGSCPNPLNITDRGNRIANLVVPVAILGTEDFDVTDINVGTVRLALDAEPIRSSLEDVATPYVDNGEDCYDCNDFGPDGWMDLTLKFAARDVVDALGPVGDGECVVVHLTGQLSDGTPFSGQDVVKIINKGP